MSYHPDPYWSEVARKIAERGDKNFLAGDDSPFFRYKRQKFLHQFHELSFAGKTVMEIGCGPGGNLNDLQEKTIKAIYGVDISADMISLAQRNLADHPLRDKMAFVHIDGTQLPFDNRAVDMIYTVTVLQHNTDEKMLSALSAEMARVADKEIVIFEKIEHRPKGTALCMGRPVSYYEALFAPHGFVLDSAAFLNIRFSHFTLTAISKIFNKPGRKEGEPLSGISVFLQKISLPITRVLDRVFPHRRELARLRFLRKS